MTKEELEKEAIKCMHEIKYWLRVPIKKETEKDGISEILKLTEPREKRIAELEDKLANADYQLEGRDIKIKELEAQIEKMKTDYEQLLDEKIELENSLAESRECY